MRYIILLFAVAVARLAHCEDLDAPFNKLKDLPSPTVSGFNKYELFLRPLHTQGYMIQGRMNGVTAKANMLQLRAESPERIPGTGVAKFVAGKTTIGDGVIDFAANREYAGSGMPEYPPDKPTAMFRSDVRRLVLVNDEVRVRIRFKDATQHYLLRYEAGKGLTLTGLDAESHVRHEADTVSDFVLLEICQEETTWQCGPLTTWATSGDKLLWSTDVQMEGQPKTLNVVGDVLFVTTTAGHSFYIRKDTGELAFYDKSVMAAVDPMKEVLAIAQENMILGVPKKSLARFIYASVILDDRRSIPFLIDCIEKGDGIPVKAMVIAALEKFNGNPEFWKPIDPETRTVNWAMVPWSRVMTTDRRNSETEHWRDVFADELTK